MSFRGTHVIPSGARNLPPSRNVRGVSVIPAQAGIQMGRERDACRWLLPLFAGGQVAAVLQDRILAASAVGGGRLQLRARLAHAG